MRPGIKAHVRGQEKHVDLTRKTANAIACGLEDLNNWPRGRFFRMGEALRQQVRLPVRDRREVEEQLQLALDDRSLEGRALVNSWALAVHIERRQICVYNSDNRRLPTPQCGIPRKKLCRSASAQQACSNMHQMRV